MPYATLRYDVSRRRGRDDRARPAGHAQRAVRRAARRSDRGALGRRATMPDVRCVVLTSTHERMFSAGANLAGFAGDTPLVEKHLGTERFPRLFRLIGELGKPTICAANGHVLAGALGIALACDLILAREGARFGTPEINVGVFPFMIMALIYRNVPRKKTNELLLLGEQISAAEAARDRDRQPGVRARGVRGRRARVGREAGRQVAAAHEAGQGRDVPPAGHGVPRRARLPARPARRSRSRPRTSRKACARSSRSASRSGRGAEALGPGRRCPA